MTRLLAIVSALLLSAALARAGGLDATSLEKVNRDVAAQWEREGRASLGAEAGRAVEALRGRKLRVGASGAEASIEGARLSSLEAAAAPAVTPLEAGGYSVRIPGEGGLALAADLTLSVRGRVGDVRFDGERVEARLRVAGFASTLAGEVDGADPARPRLTRILPPEVRFDLTVTAPGALSADLPAALREPAASLAAALVRAATASVAPALGGGASQGGLATLGLPGASAEGAARLDAAARALGAKVERAHLPSGTIASVVAKDDLGGTWEETLAAAPAPQVASHTGWSDGAALTGRWLAGEALRFAATRDPAARRNARAAMAAIHALLREKGTPGLLNRSLVPASAAGPLLEGAYAAQPDGPAGKAWQCWDDVSLEDYGAVLLGLALAHDLVDDAQARAEAATEVEAAADFLLGSGFTARARDGSPVLSMRASPEARLAWVLAAHRVNPAKYATARADAASLAEIAWTGPALDALASGSGAYARGVAGGEALFTALRLETDPFRWQRISRGAAALARSTRGQGNAYLRLLALGGDPTTGRRAVATETPRALLSWLARPRRVASLSPAATSRAERPLPLERRLPDAFAWRASPLDQIAPPSSGGARIEPPGVDFTLPYWAARALGVCAPPGGDGR